MNNSLLDFVIPNKISAGMAMRLANLLVGDLQTVMGQPSAEVYTTLSLLHLSWTQNEPITMKELIAHIENFNKRTSAMELAEHTILDKDVFKEATNNSLSVISLEVQGLIFQSLTYLTNNNLVPFHMVQRLTIDKIKVLCNLPENEVQSLVLTFNTIKQYSQMMNNKPSDFSDEQVITIIKQAAENTRQSIVLLDTSQIGAFNNLMLNKSSINTQDLDEDLDVNVFEDDENQKFEAVNKIPLANNDSQPVVPIGVEIYNRNDAVTIAQKIAKMPPQEGNAFQKQLAIDLAQSSSFRIFTEIPVDYKEKLDSLYTRFPHFSEVIDFVSERLALSSCGTNGKPIKLAPILLLGSPGTGKTYFAQELAKYLSLNFIEKDLSITSEAFVIAGMDSGWKNSKPGIVFNSLVQGQTANPMICINEIDKCSIGDSRNSPLTALHWLLEPTSSHKFQDEFISLDLRADHIVWVATANDGHIPEPILSRFEVFNIEKPTQEQCKAIAKSVWTSLCATEFPIGHGFSLDLSSEILEQISSISPRVMRKALTHMAAKAVTNQRKNLLLQDFQSSIQRYNEVSKGNIGFF